MSNNRQMTQQQNQPFFPHQEGLAQGSNPFIDLGQQQQQIPQYPPQNQVYQQHFQQQQMQSVVQQELEQQLMQQQILQAQQQQQQQHYNIPSQEELLQKLLTTHNQREQALIQQLALQQQIQKAQGQQQQQFVEPNGLQYQQTQPQRRVMHNNFTQPQNMERTQPKQQKNHLPPHQNVGANKPPQQKAYFVTKLTEQVGIILQHLAVIGDQIETESQISSQKDKSHKNTKESSAFKSQQQSSPSNNDKNYLNVSGSLKNVRSQTGLNSDKSFRDAQEEEAGIDNPVGPMDEEQGIQMDFATDQEQTPEEAKSGERSGQMNISRNSSSISASPFESCVKSPTPPGLYFYRICHKLKMPDEHTVCVLVLINRVCEMSHLQFKRIYNRTGRMQSNSNKTGVSINSLTIHRLILVAILITHKFYTDPFYLNNSVAYIGGVQLQELNFLEEEFLELINFNISVDNQEYEDYITGLKAHFIQPLQPETIQIIEEINQALAHQQEQTKNLLLANSQSSSLSLKILQQLQNQQQQQQNQPMSNSMGGNNNVNNLNIQQLYQYQMKLQQIQQIQKMQTLQLMIQQKKQLSNQLNQQNAQMNQQQQYTQMQQQQQQQNTQQLYNQLMMQQQQQSEHKRLEAIQQEQICRYLIQQQIAQNQQQHHHQDYNNQISFAGPQYSGTSNNTFDIAMQQQINPNQFHQMDHVNNSVQPPLEHQKQFPLSNTWKTRRSLKQRDEEPGQMHTAQSFRPSQFTQEFERFQNNQQLPNIRQKQFIYANHIDNYIHQNQAQTDQQNVAHQHQMMTVPQENVQMQSEQLQQQISHNNQEVSADQETGDPQNAGQPVVYKFQEYKITHWN